MPFTIYFTSYLPELICYFLFYYLFDAEDIHKELYKYIA